MRSKSDLPKPTSSDKYLSPTHVFAQVLTSSAGETVLVFWETNLDNAKSNWIVHRVGKVGMYLYDVPMLGFTHFYQVESYMSILSTWEADKIMVDVKKEAERWESK